MAVDPGAFLGSGDARITPEEHFEAFDARKRQRVEDLAREEEDLLREIAALKRRVPRTTADAYAESARAGLAADEAAAEAARATVREAPKGRSLVLGKEGSGTGDGAGGTTLLPRQSEVEAAFAGIVGGLDRLKKDMPATVAKMERSRVAGEYAVAGR